MRLMFILVLFLNVFTAKAQYHIEVLDSLSDGTIKFAHIQSKEKSATVKDSKSFLKEILKTETDTDFYLRDIRTDDMGMMHEKYQQTYFGIKVVFGEYIVHKNKDGFIVSINGNYGRLPKDIKRMPTLSFEGAFAKGVSDSKMKNVTLHPLRKEKSIEKYTTQGTDEYELVFVMGNDKQWHLAYKANITPEKITDNRNVYISCDTGDVVFVQPMVFKSNANGTAETRYSGPKSITTDSDNGQFRLSEVLRGGSNTAIQTFNFLRNPLYFINDLQTGVANAIDFTDNDNDWTALEYDNQDKDNGALDAHWGAEMTFDYFHSIHGRNSYDDNNSTIKNYVHVRDRLWGFIPIDMDNAFWLSYLDGTNLYEGMFYGDGYTDFDILTSLDVIAHEIAHGICQYSVGTEGLLYQGESGAINESLSDIWGACVENWATNDKEIWLIGEDITLSYPCLRNMQDPGSTNLPQPDTYGGPNWWDPNDGWDYGGVHVNSGVMNYWFYLLSDGGSNTNGIGNAYNVTGIGIDKAAKIVYKAETECMISTTDFNMARECTIEAASNLYGNCTPEVIGVTNAWYAVGVGNQYIPTPVNFTGTTTTPITVASNTTIVSCDDINNQNVIVTGNNVVLILEAAGNINVQNVKVQNNAKLILDAAGEVNIISDFDVDLGSEFEIK